MDAGDHSVPLRQHIQELRSVERELAIERQRVNDLRHDAICSQIAIVTKQHELVQERWGRRFEEEARETKERLAALAHRDELQERKMEAHGRLLYIGVGLAMAVEIAFQVFKH